MKSDTERKRYHSEPLHKRKNRMHVHLSKELRKSLKVNKRSILVRKGDTVKVMRGPGKGKEAKISDVNTVRRKVYVEGVVSKSAKGRESPAPLEASNMMLMALEPTPERKKLFSEEAFKKEKPKKAEKPEAKKDAKAEAPKAEPKKEAPKEAPKETAKEAPKAEMKSPAAPAAKEEKAPEAPKK